MHPTTCEAEADRGLGVYRSGAVNRGIHTMPGPQSYKHLEIIRNNETQPIAITQRAEQKQAF